MKILLAADDCRLGGHSCFMLALGAGLTQRGHTVHCFFFQDDGYAHAFMPHFPTTIGGVTTLRNLLCQQRYDVVHGDSCMMDLPAVLKPVSDRPPLVITRHSWNAPMGWGRANCNGYSAVCESAAALSRPYTDIRVVAIPNGVDALMFQPRVGPVADRPIVAWCGRSSDPVKNWAQFVSVTWRLGGDLAYHAADADAETAPDAGEAGAGHISLRRRFSREELPDFYSAIGRSGGCLISTSRAEGGRPLAMLEAMACGCPVLGPDVRGVSDLLTGDLRRWLFRPDADDAEVARFVRDALKELAEPAVREQFRRYVLEHCTQELMVARYEQFYRDAAASPCAGDDAPREIAQRLWTFASEARDQGRTRDAMFAARAATRLAPSSLLQPRRFALLASCGNDSRMRGARAVLRAAQAQFDRNDYRARLGALLTACRLHPAALLAPESPLRARSRA